MKKLRAILSLVIMISLMLQTTSYSASNFEKIEVLKNYGSIEVNGKKLKSKTYLYGDNQYAPVNEIAQALGAKVNWNDKTMSLSIKTTQNNSSDLTYKDAVDAMEPSLSGLKLGFAPDAVDGYKLEKNGAKVIAAITFEKDSIKITPEGWLDYNTNYLLKIFLNDGNRVLLKFKTGGLPKLVTGSSRKIIFVPADPSKGFNYPYYMVLPSKRNVELNKGKKNYLFVESHNTGKVGDSLEFHIKEAYQIAEGNSAPIADKLGLPRIVPIIVRPESLINGQWVYTHALSRNVLTLEALKLQAGNYNEVFEPMDRVDRQVVNMIKHANNYLEDNGWKMEDKVFIWGFSASGDFASRFSFLYPELVKAACFSGFPVIPLKTEGGYNMVYPLGTYDYKTITGKDFNLKDYNNVARLSYVGSADTNQPCLQDTEYEREIVRNLLAEVEYPDKWPKAKKLFEKAGGEAQVSVYIGAGHEIFYKGMTDDYMNFFVANRDSSKPVYVKPSDPKTTTTDIYSKNVIEMKKKPFSYDKTTITEVFWSGTLPQTLPQRFVDWFKTSDSSNYKDEILFIAIDEWDPGNGSQMGDRINKVGGSLVLRAKGYKDIRINISGDISDGTGDVQMYRAIVENVNDVVSGVKYKVVDEKGHWVALDDVYTERPVQ